MNHVTCIYASCYTYTNKSCTSTSNTQKHGSCHTYAWVMSHVCMSHVTRMHESCHTYAWVMSHVWMSHVTRMHESCTWESNARAHGSCHTYMNESCVTNMNASYHTMNESFVKHMGHDTCLDESCHVDKRRRCHIDESCHIKTQRRDTCLCDIDDVI